MTDPLWFQAAVLGWFDKHGRKDLPWQQQLTPYRVWVSEIMLQQTQVTTVIPYYHRFMAAFPDVRALAAADIDQVLHLWTGLGYYARARNLHRAAIEVVETLDGEFPRDLEGMQQLPGIGRSTAGAILAIASNVRAPILDGNVKRVLCRFEAVAGWPGKTAVQNRLWELAERYTPERRLADYTQAMMDLGATLCTRSRPDCGRCPLADRCEALAAGQVDRYPEPRPKRSVPEKQGWMLLLQDGRGRILLRRRPPAGIWGGLWCFPQYDSEQALRQVADGAGYQPLSQAALAPFTHTFSHFRLRVVPVRMALSEQSRRVEEAGDELWFDPDNPARVGLATPVKKLLGQLQKGT